MRHIVTPDGRIDDKRIWRRETIYKGMGGKLVERINVTPAESVIFKPIGSDENRAGEAWIYNNVLPAFPPVYPKMLAASQGGGSEEGWALFEDLGPLRHEFDEETARALLSHVAAWHAIPARPYRSAPLRGPKPNADAVRSEMLPLLEDPRMLESLVAAPPGRGPVQLCDATLDRLPERIRGDNPGPVPERFRIALRQERFHFPSVLSHGDLHVGNYVMLNGQIKVLDWEHVHLNCRYWDIYHAVDLSHPLFPKSVSPDARDRLLDHYVREVERHPDGGTLEAGFKRRYYLFSALFSLWMLKLIAGDIAGGGGPWPLEGLERQRRETQSAFIECAERC
ncbi:phosphotransferase [Paenibacillus arenilitoris]|uniref:Phosphotransferase n=1 Tax=Paenibacillus arenilitoris TaxID=2772299 RepID=A0A927H8D2_9BACL|nr:phosphotransferase [Paenibacillus arenilitoris]MBD2871563.1 phosphotransferase [Paenibacillus arenilitoris]